MHGISPLTKYFLYRWVGSNYVRIKNHHQLYLPNSLHSIYKNTTNNKPKIIKMQNPKKIPIRKIPLKKIFNTKIKTLWKSNNSKTVGSVTLSKMIFSYKPKNGKETNKLTWKLLLLTKINQAISPNKQSDNTIINKAKSYFLNKNQHPIFNWFLSKLNLLERN